MHFPFSSYAFLIVCYSLFWSRVFDHGLKEKLPPTDSRLRPDQRHLENGEYEKANMEKQRLEKRQRMVCLKALCYIVYGKHAFYLFFSLPLYLEFLFYQCWKIMNVGLRKIERSDTNNTEYIIDK